MRKLLSIGLLLATLSLFAGHERGGIIITYEPVPNQPLQYELTVRALYEGGGFSIPPPTSLTVNASSACFNNTSYSLPKIGSASGVSPILGADYCSTVSSANYQGIVMYKSTITLPAHCSNITFWLASGFGRFNNMVNINSTSGTSYFYAKLNTLSGPNKSPQVADIDLMQVACVNKQVNLYSFTDADGDSLYFVKSTPQRSTGGANFTNYSWNMGYSQSNPVGGTGTYSINNANGEIQTSFTNVGTYILPIKYFEYRKDTSQPNPVLVGEGLFNFMVSATAACSAPSAINILQQSNQGGDSVACGSATVTFISSRQIARSSVTLSGSEFTVTSQKQGNLMVNSATVLQDSIIEVTLNQSPPLNDTLTLTAQAGADNNVIVSRCGIELTANNDTLYFFTPGGVQPNVNGTLSNQFLNASYNATSSIADSIWWNFGDGTGTDQNTGVHNYSAPGLYQVILTAFGACGSSEDTTYTIQVCDSISAAFTYSQSGDTIFFNVNMPNPSAIYSWDFGDGNNGSGDSTFHVYAPGSGYLAQLTVANICGDTVIFSDSVLTCAEPIPSWTYTVVSTTAAGMTVDFDGTASVNVVSFEWDFGDGTLNNTSLTPRHVYQTPGLHYYVSLSVTNSCNQQRIKGFRMNEIGVDEYAVVPAFELFPNPVEDVLKIHWKDRSVYPVKLELFNTSGKMIDALTFEGYSNTIEMSLENQVSGQYILQITDNHGRRIQQIITKK